MGLLDGIFSVCRRVGQFTKDTYDLYTNLPSKTQEITQIFQELWRKDWSKASELEREAAVSSIKKRVIHELIPLAGQLSLAGAPGIVVYSPCQIAGALTIAKVYSPEYALTPKYMLTVAGVMLWGKVGQLAWIQLAEILMPLLTPPVVGIAVIPYVQTWTEIALNRVHDYYNTEFYGKSQDSKPQQPSSTHSAVNLPKFTAEEAKNSVVVKEANKLLEQISRGGKVLFSAQEEVFRELIENKNGKSALNLGYTHIFRGVAGSGKTVILGQLIPHVLEAFNTKYNRYPQILIYHHNNYINQLLGQEIRSAMQKPILADPFPDWIFERNIYVHNLSTLTQELRKRQLLHSNFSRPDSLNSGERAKNIDKSLTERDGVFDIICVDEGQDICKQEYDLLNALCRSSNQTNSKSMYIFYDDFQNIFGLNGFVIDRLQSQQPNEHFLSRCVRTSKKIMDFTLNTCLGSAIDNNSKIALENLIGIQKLKERNLIFDSYTQEGKNWLNCQFCVFPGEVIPEVQQFSSNRECLNALNQDIGRLLAERNLEKAVQGGILIVCFTKNMVKQVAELLEQKFGQQVKRRSGDDIVSVTKRTNLAVEQKSINVALVWDAKGYDADVVYVINPDSGSADALRKRTQFYVAATRAKQFLAVYSSIPERDAPILYDAMKAVRHMERTQQ